MKSQRSHYLTTTVSFVVLLAAIGSSGRVACADLHPEGRASAPLKSLHWQRGTTALAQSHGTLATPAGARIVVGADAQKLDEYLNGTDSSDEEAIVDARPRLVYLSYTDSGFVKDDDWKDVDAAKMLEQMKQSTNDENTERRKHDVAPFYVDRWIQEPTFDSARKSVRWIVAMHSAKTRFINAIALQLGRGGYERFTLVSDGKNPAADRATLAAYVNDYRFDRGFRFSDYVSGDKVADFGVAALVGTAAGVTLAKTGAFAAILIFFKKFFLVFVAAAVAAYGRLKKSWGSRAKFGPPHVPPPAA